MFDLDDFGAPVSEDPASCRHEGKLRDLEDANAFHYKSHGIFLLKSGTRRMVGPPSTSMVFGTFRRCARVSLILQKAVLIDGLSSIVRRPPHFAAAPVAVNTGLVAREEDRAAGRAAPGGNDGDLGAFDLPVAAFAA
ncbi:hypothetical protein GCM10019060_35570 [Novosphingobium pokkalii]|nr:hypothetical protein GCM10019060_35570 [Novosphingobium pokkalii]